jgi:DNA-binding LacI/PurR family transcriptional regulator
MKRPTIVDVARASGVSKTTVSKVMNIPADRLDVPESTRERVLAVSREMGYQPSWRARAFAKGKTRTIGLVHCEAVPMFGGELWHAMVSQLVDDLHQAGYDAQFVPADPAGQRWREMLLDQRLDACVIFHELPPEVAETLKAAKLPAVLLNAIDDDHACVVPDDRQGGRTVTQHLIDLGHRHIAFIDNAPNARHFSFFQRRAGFMDAITDAGLKDSATLISAENGVLAERLLAVSPRPTAVVAYADSTVLPLLHGCWKRGMRVPQDLAVATFNDVAVTRYATPPLTTMDVPTRAMAQRAVELLLERIRAAADGQVPPPQTERLAERLIVRESTART